MASEERERRRHSTNRNRFLILCMYAGAYILLRYHGEVVVQNITLPAARGGYSHTMVSPHPTLPYWRQQLWRGLFSLPMVIEEESNRAAKKGQEMAWSGQPSNPGLAPGEKLVYVAPPGQAPAPQYQNGIAARQQTGNNYPGLAPGEQLLYVAPPGESPMTYIDSGGTRR